MKNITENTQGADAASSVMAVIAGVIILFATWFVGGLLMEATAIGALIVYGTIFMSLWVIVAAGIYFLVAAMVASSVGD